MRSLTTLIRMSLVSVGLAVGGVMPTVAQEQEYDTLYRLIELPGEGGEPSKAYALNNTGQVIGWLEAGGSRHSAHWHIEVTTDLHGTVHFDLAHPYWIDPLSPYFDQGYGEAYDISDADQIVGTARSKLDFCPKSVIVTNAYLLRPAVLTDLGTPYPGDALTNLLTLGNPCAGLDSAATGISNSNHVVGWADIDFTKMHAFLARPVGGLWFLDEDPNDFINDMLVDLGTLPPANADTVSSATAVNDDGHVTGYSYTTTADDKAAYHAFRVVPEGEVWFVDAGGSVNDLMEDLGTLGGNNSWGRAINNDSQIVGESDTDPNITDGHFTRAFLWETAVITDLGTLGGNNSAASGINDEGAIVGWAENTDGQRRAVVWVDGEAQDLNDMLCTLTADGIAVVPDMILTEARDINEDGWIVGWGAVRGSDSGETRGFLLAPMDPNACLAEEDDSEDASGTEDGGGDGDGYDGEPVAGTPGNLGDDAADDGAGDGDAEPGPDAAALCGVGTAGFVPLTVFGLCWMKTGQARRIRRRG